MRGTISEQLRRRLRILRLLDQLDDLGKGRVSAHLGGAIAQRAALVDRRPNDFVADVLGHRHRLAGKHRFIDGRRALDHLAVDRKLVAGPQDHDVAEHDVGGCNLDLLAITENRRPWRGEVEQGPDRGRSPGAGAHLQPVAEQDEHEEHARRLVELLPLEEEGSADAEQVAGAYAQHHQHRHVEHSVAQGPPSGDQERPDRIEDRGAGEEKHRQVIT